MYDKYNALVENGTWILVSRPPGTNLVYSMWLFKHKFHADGTLSRYKARLVAKDSSQQLGVDFDETFSLVMKPATICMVLSLAMSCKWPIHQLDVKNAFLNGDLSKTVNMHQPPWFVDSRYPNHHTLYRSSAKAEYQGVANVVVETSWLYNLLRELHSPLLTATLVYCDNIWLPLVSMKHEGLLEIFESIEHEIPPVLAGSWERTPIPNHLITPINSISSLASNPPSGWKKYHEEHFEQIVWGLVRDVRSECLRLGDIKLLLVAFDSQLKVFHPLLNDNTSGEHL
ncbi:ribonuclease H-like domain-containing protein [Tanacetum coccineum]